MLGPTIFDLCHLLGLPIDGEVVVPKIEEDPEFVPGKYNILYSSFIDKECKVSTTIDDREYFVAFFSSFASLFFVLPHHACEISAHERSVSFVIHPWATGQYLSTRQ